MTEPDEYVSDSENYLTHGEEQHRAFFGMPLYETEQERRRREAGSNPDTR